MTAGHTTHLRIYMQKITDFFIQKNPLFFVVFFNFWSF